MKVFIAILSVLVCACVVAGDVSHLTAAKAKLIGKLTRGRHNKRGVLSAVPPFKLGHDLPRVTHSILKPLIVTYPPTALPFAVKVPLTHPAVPRYPVPIGHKVPVPHPHYGLKFPHHTKTFVLPKPDQHFHHYHHHHVAKPVVPVVPAVPAVPATPLPTPVFPVAQPSVPVAQPLPAPPPPLLLQPTPLVPVSPLHHLHLRPIVPAAPVAPVAPPAYPPLLPVAPHYNYVLRPGNAIQTSVFATYPRYPFGGFPGAFPGAFPVAQPTPVNPLFLDRPVQVPNFHFLQQGAAHGLAEPQPIALQPTPTILQPHDHHHDFVKPQPTALQPTPTIFQPHDHHHDFVQPQPTAQYDHNGWSPINSYEASIHHQEESHHVSQEQVPQVYEHHSQEEQQYHELQHQIHQHIQQQIGQAHLDQQYHNQNNINQEYGPPQLNHQEYHQDNQDFGAQEQNQVSQEYGVLQHLDQQYGAPQGFEGRSSESEEEGQKYQNHIPLGLQPPIDRPAEKFR